MYGDSARFVTRSVANHVNDISKLDPDLAVDTLQRWRRSGRQCAKEMDYVVWRATRTLIQLGNARAMELLGVPTHIAITVSKLTLPDRVELGSHLEFRRRPSWPCPRVRGRGSAARTAPGSR
jgi:hypothetical protein